MWEMELNSLQRNPPESPTYLSGKIRRYLRKYFAVHSGDRRVRLRAVLANFGFVNISTVDFAQCLLAQSPTPRSVSLRGIPKNLVTLPL